MVPRSAPELTNEAVGCRMLRRSDTGFSKPTKNKAQEWHIRRQNKEKGQGLTYLRTVVDGETDLSKICFFKL